MLSLLAFGLSLLTTSRPPAPRAAARLAASSAPSFSLPSPIETLKRLSSAEARELQRELLELAFEQDPQVVVRRSLDLARAVRVVGSETVQGLSSAAAAPEPPVILRRMCEELGATYVKLGQFIASSPTLFPAEYVQEFQKCLDATPPMPWCGAEHTRMQRQRFGLFSEGSSEPSA